MKIISITAISIMLMGATTHDTMYKALEKAANNAIVESGGCGQLTFKRTERFIASSKKVTGNSISVTYEKESPRIIKWEAPTERLDGSTDLVIGSYELTISCPEYNKVFLFSEEERGYEICGLSGYCTFSLIAIDSDGIRSEPGIVNKEI